MPSLNNALIRSPVRSAMRLASSDTTMVSGTLTSRYCLAAGPLCIWARFSFSRARLSAASERARAPSPSSSALVTVSLPDWRRSSPPGRPLRAGRGAGSGRRTGWNPPGRRGARSSVSGGATAATSTAGAAATGTSSARATTVSASTLAVSTEASSALRFSSTRRFSSSDESVFWRSSRRRASSSAFIRDSSASRSNFVCIS